MYASEIMKMEGVLILTERLAIKSPWLPYYRAHAFKGMFDNSGHHTAQKPWWQWLHTQS